MLALLLACTPTDALLSMADAQVVGTHNSYHVNIVDFQPWNYTHPPLDEQVVQVEYQGGDSVPIPGYVGYRLVSVGSREVSISYPPSAPCVNAEDQGVRCRSEGQGTLSLRTAAPVVVASTEGQEAQAEGEQEAAEQNENPFAAALRAAAQNEAAANGRPRGNGQRFEPRRIPPDEVPPGMRVVRTPFGDRLVEL